MATITQAKNRLLGFNRVLCLSPHPDDVEYSMAATIMKYDGTHFDLLTLSDGAVLDTPKSLGEKRLEEVHNVWDKSAITNYSLFVTSEIHPEMPMFSPNQQICKIERDFFKDYHDAIFIPPCLDSHFEHRQTNELGAALGRNKPISIVEYKTPSTLNEWSPNMWVNVDEFIERKLEILQQFVSQQHHWYFKEESLKYFHIDFQSFKKGYSYVEHYKIKQLYRK